MPAKLTKEEFISKCLLKYGDKYNYLKVDYINSKTKVIITCNKHGDFLKSPVKFLNSNQECPECTTENFKSSVAERFNFDDFVSKANIVHSSKYDYSKVSYINTKTRIEIVCPIHGSFFHTVGNHLNGCGCPKCKNINNGLKKRYSNKTFCNLASNVHNDFYKYSNANYIKSQIKVAITCPVHGDFYQMPYMHLFGAGCPKCSVSFSKTEEYIYNYISNKGFDVISRYRGKELLGKEIDIYVPSLKLGIEYCGSAYHHSSASSFTTDYLRNTSRPKTYHYDKWAICKQNGIRLITIFDFLWLVKKEKYLSLIDHALNLDVKIHARKTTISEASNKDAKSFYEDNHLEDIGLLYKDAKSYCLTYNDIPYMYCTIGYIYNQSTKCFDLKLQRICTLRGYCVVGGISKLSNFLYKKYGSFIYETTNDTGSTIDGLSSSANLRYWWVRANRPNLFYTRNRCQKHLLENLLGSPLLENDTESTYMERHGFIKVYDSGLTRIDFYAKN